MLHVIPAIAAALFLHSTTPPPACVPLPGARELLARPRLQFVMFGESHGTRELPELFADAVCAAAGTGRPLIVGIELPGSEQPALDRYMASDGAAEARAALLASPRWREPGGRTTTAIFDAIERMRVLARRQVPLRLIAFDGPLERGTSAPREAAMAATLQAAAAAEPDALVLVLTGAGHADRRGWTGRTPPFPSAAGLLPPGRTMLLAYERPGGYHWACHSPTGDRSAGCAVYEMPAREPPGARGIRLDPASRDGFDGLFSAGRPYTSSRPALAPASDQVSAEGRTRRPGE